MELDDVSAEATSRTARTGRGRESRVAEPTRLARRLAAVALALVFGLTATRSARAAAADSAAVRPAFPTAKVRAWQTGPLRPDRLQHASLSFALASGAAALGGRPAAAVAGVFALGALKELWDVRTTGFDPADLGADAAGAALGGLAGSAIRR